MDDNIKDYFVFGMISKKDMVCLKKPFDTIKLIS